MSNYSRFMVLTHFKRPNALRSPQQGDLRLLGPPSDRGADGGAGARDRRVLADLRADPQATVPPTPPRDITVIRNRCLNSSIHSLSANMLSNMMAIRKK
ncbi:hypothetical protein PoB_003749600 [Plakobranchus ocellatus]|uniref:Uncharacterized protein n=1 Tax=Plakobranchus ocellatus TaxID=259542 RepID=A0AAV4AIJ9_9GAST|nr:hypothetical protein PoB_003749600 [Plakobranchus ocellatus]